MAVLKGGGSSTGINIPLSDILGNRYNGILLKYRMNLDGSVASVYPILQ